MNNRAINVGERVFITEAGTFLRCPGCNGMGEIDDDQYHGRVSVLCDCGYHETKDWSAEQ